MKKFTLITLITLASYLSTAQNIANAAYPYDRATQVQKDVTPGEIIKKEFTKSKIYPGTSRKYSIYVPASYSPEKPACLYVCMDGILFNAPTVFDNLIASDEMPITIGVFVGSGEVLDGNNEVLRFNRSNEYDKTDDTFVRFLLEELLPDVEKQKTNDGRSIRLSKNPNDRAIAGVSSGAICAFTAAWQRPDKFSRLFSSIGTYVAMRGGNEYPALIRKTEPKPLRIFLEDGINDVWNPLFGNWYEANLLMESALNFAGYELEHNWGRGAHDDVHATNIFPDVMRWLWKGYPSPVKKGTSLNNMLTSILLKGSEWQEVQSNISPLSGLFADGDGNIIFQNNDGSISKIDSTNTVTTERTLDKGEKLIGTDGKGLYIVNSKGTIIRMALGKNSKRTIADGILNAKQLITTSKKDIYITQEIPDKANKLWLIKENGTKKMINNNLRMGNNIAIYPNQKLLMQSEKNSHWIYSHVINPSGTLINTQRFYWLHNTDNFNFNNLGNMVFDQNGNLYVASAMGVQVCDQNGRVRAILTLPSGRISSVMFGGKNFDVLYVVSDNKLYRRKLNATGAPTWMKPTKVASQGAG
ncbi:MAG: hypothetical protein CR985_02625 [Flavobacteriales bacterium]|nr:MAG: hypothetical protein CR985_02625 [Flavobacteriales bacterium]